MPTINSEVLGSYPPSSYTPSFVSGVQICQLCNTEGHTAPVCDLKRYESIRCCFCGKSNHTTWNCFYNDIGPNFIGVASYSPIHPSPHQHTVQAMNIVLHTYPSLSSQPSSQVWITDTGATNHMTIDLSNFALSTPFPSTDTIHTADDEGLSVSHIDHSILLTSLDH